jgi:hypothetical protein
MDLHVIQKIYNTIKGQGESFNFILRYNNVGGRRLYIYIYNVVKVGKGSYSTEYYLY